MNYIDPTGLHTWYNPAQGNTIPHHHDPNNGMPIAGYEDLPNREFEGMMDANKNAAYLAGKAGALYLGFEVGCINARLGEAVYEFADFLVDYLFGKPASIPKIPIPDIVNPPDAGGDE